MNIGEISGLQVMVTPETYKEMQKQKTIEENKILKEQQEEIERLNNIIEKAVEYINNYFVLGAGSEYKRKLTDILNGRSDE